jgi:hypothetical protein
MRTCKAGGPVDACDAVVPAHHDCTPMSSLRQTLSCCAWHQRSEHFLISERNHRSTSRRARDWFTMNTSLLQLKYSPY